MSGIDTAASRRYQGIVFSIAAPTEDFSCSTEIVLPGAHTRERAWELVLTELRTRGEHLAGGDVRPC